VIAGSRSFLASKDCIHAIRRFNRFYTRQIGVLDKHLLDSPFSLTEVRLLYELAHRAGVTAVELRQELGLDRGYLSRMLQNFEARGWIKTSRSAADRRRILLSLTRPGYKVFAPLDHRSSAQVGAMLARLSAAEQDRLLAAMGEIEGTLDRRSEGRIPRGLRPAPKGAPSAETNADLAPPPPRTAAPGTFFLRRHRPGDMGWVVQRHGELYWDEYRYDERFEALVAGIVAEFIQNLDPRREACWIAEKDNHRVGTIFLVKKSRTVAKLRLLLVEPSARGLGIGKRLISQCLSFARRAGYKKVVLWTQSELRSARHLYQRGGFKRIAEQPHQSWGRTDLVSETWEVKL
jgi:DNA-binding MarR family transcriptional regulator/GNAT superfamily N-acetyltransferase